MVLEIRLENFFSINEEVVLDMRAARIQTKKAMDLEGNTFACNDERMLKSVAIYGANASGKSNIIKAIRACVQMIFESHNYNENTVFGFTPFKFGGIGKPSRFMIRFLINGIEYEYSFSMTKLEIITEDLYYYPHGRRSLVFARDERKGPDKKDIYEFRSAISRPMDVATNTSKKTLFVSRASQMDRKIAKEVFQYFMERFILNYFGYNSYSIETLLNQNKDSLLKVLNVADSDIIDIQSQRELKPLTMATYDLQNNQIVSRDEIQKMQLKITTFHRNNPEIPFDFATEESQGTQALFYMMLTIMNIITITMNTTTTMITKSMSIITITTMITRSMSIITTTTMIMKNMSITIIMSMMRTAHAVATIMITIITMLMKYSIHGELRLLTSLKSLQSKRL